MNFEAVCNDMPFSRILLFPFLLEETIHVRPFTAAAVVLQTTALVHEAYMKLVSSPAVKWQDRAHFFAVASQQMRRILVDAARTRLRKKRGGDAPLVSLDDAHRSPLRGLLSLWHWMML